MGNVAVGDIHVRIAHGQDPVSEVGVAEAGAGDGMLAQLRPGLKTGAASCGWRRSLPWDYDSARERGKHPAMKLIRYFYL